MPLKFINRLNNLIIILALGVVMLGAYTRLTDAGLGCPDWPGCYGQLILGQTTEQLQQAQVHFPNQPIEVGKALTEMAHRYAAGTLVVLIVSLIASVAFSKYQNRLTRRLSWFLVALLAFQATLGMWTVTLKLLPIVVMGHLFGGILIFTSIVYLRAVCSNLKPLDLIQWRRAINLGLVLVGMQIALGGWVSANYAGIACIGFPQCNGHWLPHMDWREAFNLSASPALNHQGGLLNNQARVTIQMMHRIGALIVFMYLLPLGALLQHYVRESTLRIYAKILILLVILQCLLGITNVMYFLPLWAAVFHNGGAALLLANLVILFYKTGRGQPA